MLDPLPEIDSFLGTYSGAGAWIDDAGESKPYRVHQSISTSEQSTTFMISIRSSRRLQAQVAADAAQNDPLDGITAHANMVRTGYAVPMAAACMAASIRNDVVSLANIADEQTAQQVLRPAAALEPFIAVGGNARAGLRSFKQRIRNDPQGLVAMLDPLRLRT